MAKIRSMHYLGSSNNLGTPLIATTPNGENRDVYGAEPGDLSYSPSPSFRSILDVLIPDPRLKEYFFTIPIPADPHGDSLNSE